MIGIKELSDKIQEATVKAQTLSGTFKFIMEQVSEHDNSDGSIDALYMLKGYADNLAAEMLDIDIDTHGLISCEQEGAANA